MSPEASSCHPIVGSSAQHPWPGGLLDTHRVNPNPSCTQSAFPRSPSHRSDFARDRPNFDLATPGDLAVAVAYIRHVSLEAKWAPHMSPTKVDEPLELNVIRQFWRRNAPPDSKRVLPLGFGASELAKYSSQALDHWFGCRVNVGSPNKQRHAPNHRLNGVVIIVN